MSKSKSTLARWLLGTFTVLSLSVLLTLCILQQPKTQAASFEVRGFDVSHHQGDIAWEKISPEQYDFVYIKATEGAQFQDRLFKHNWQQARQQGLRVGAYHFYRLCRSAQVQAENFIRTVPKAPNALPPVIDLEYDPQCIDQFNQQQLLQQIQLMYQALQQHYGQAPIFYVSKNFYNIVLAGHFPHVPLWVREYQGLPQLKGQPQWTFWQHSRQGQIEGIQGPVDLNVFYGSKLMWYAFLAQQ